MSKFLTYTEIDVAIQRRMANEAPDENVRLEAINTAMQDLYAQFDIETSRREYALSAIPDGTTIDMDAELDGFKKAINLKYAATDKLLEKFNQVDVEIFDIHISEGRKINEYATYYNNGKLYLKVNSSGGETVATSFTLIYHTYYNSQNAGVLQDELTNTEGGELLMPKRYKSLIVIKSMMYCMPIALGLDSEIAMRRLEKEFNIEVMKLDIDMAKKPKTAAKQLNLKPLW